MITRPKVWQRTQRRLQAEERLTRAQAVRIYESLYQEARRLGALPPDDPLEGLENALRLAAALNGLVYSVTLNQLSGSRRQRA